MEPYKQTLLLELFKNRYMIQEVYVLDDKRQVLVVADHTPEVNWQELNKLLSPKWHELFQGWTFSVKNTKRFLSEEWNQARCIFQEQVR